MFWVLIVPYSRTEEHGPIKKHGELEDMGSAPVLRGAATKDIQNPKECSKSISHDVCNEVSVLENAYLSN